MLTTFDLDEYVFAALQAGASGFLLKDIPRAGLLAAVRAVATGEVVVARAHPPPARPVRPRAPPAPRMTRVHRLSPRARDVAVQVARGLSNAEIAGHCGQ